nr:retrovirus-related Pol polyprotein from transposon TNT 1-94 [Tanacetum cinerariifolium]GEZ62737.1 retrovirus-related Pol polyprotein from transposon TNT 1-94 [Tanacetum cinerariifolium]
MENSKKGNLPLHSKTDVELDRMTCVASKEAIWMKNFIIDLGVVPTIQDPIEIFYDNESVVALTKEPKDNRKSKHIERKYHFVRSKVEEGHVIVKHIRSEDNPADLFTKALAKSRHDKHDDSLIEEVSAPKKKMNRKCQLAPAKKMNQNAEEPWDKVKRKGKSATSQASSAAGVDVEALTRLMVNEY